MDDDGFADLADRAYRYALALTGDPERAADAVQDAWVAVLRCGGPLAIGYLLTAVRSRVIDQSRRPRLVLVTDDDLRAASNREGNNPTGMDEVGSDRLDAALARLREDEREALYLTVVEGWSVAAVANQQRRPRGSVLSVLHRARAKLRTWLTCAEERRHG